LVHYYDQIGQIELIGPHCINNLFNSIYKLNVKNLNQPVHVLKQKLLECDVTILDNKGKQSANSHFINEDFVNYNTEFTNHIVEYTIEKYI